MGRYSEYFNNLWELKAKQTTIGIGLFGVLFENKNPFTPGDQLEITDGADIALSNLAKKGYDFVVFTGQPYSRTKDLEIDDFENILNATNQLMQGVGARLKNAYYAPSTDKNDPYVKPNTGMFERASNEKMIDWSKSMFIGAEPVDTKIAQKINTKSVILTSLNADYKFKSFEQRNRTTVQTYSSFLEFAEKVENRLEKI